MSKLSRNSIRGVGLSEVYSNPTGSHVDLVFIHGLNGHPFDTWASEKDGLFWPTELLTCWIEQERVRILVYGYDAEISSFMDNEAGIKIHIHAENLIAELSANRRRAKAVERPIVFVAHSLGGLVLKRALIYSSEIRGNHTEHLRSIFVSTYGILFFGTPHNDLNVEKCHSRLERIWSAILPGDLLFTQSSFIDALKINSETLQNINRQFIQLTRGFHIYFFHEGKPSRIKESLQYIVDEESASPNIQDVERATIQQDHFHMCKFEDINAPGFNLVAEGIQRYVSEAPKTVELRWQQEKEERLRRKKAEVKELFVTSSNQDNVLEQFASQANGQSSSCIFDRFQADVNAVQNPFQPSVSMTINSTPSCGSREP